jgi:hypothetical protein
MKLGDVEENTVFKIKDVRNIPLNFWRWRNFTPLELCSPDDFSLTLDFNAVNSLQALRDRMSCPLIITSAYRSLRHNARVGGVESSMHRKGRAFDILLTKNFYPHALVYSARQSGFNGIGLYDTFIHVDTGRFRHWDERKYKNAYNVNLDNEG